MSTYLFTWNPKVDQGMYDDYQNWIEGRLPSVGWSSGTNKSIPSGARFFLMRQGVDPKGIIGAGYTVSGWRTGESSFEPRRLMNVNDIAFEVLTDPDNPIVPLEKLLEIEDKKAGLWLSASGGIRIPEDAAQALELAWAEAVARAGLTTAEINPDDIEDAPGDAEGRTNYITHLVRERSRNLVARKKAEAMSRLGKLRCEGCDVVLAERYGPVAVNVIECHHVKWLADTGETITRLEDLALLCPNCHRIMHVARYRTIADLRRAIRETQPRN